MARSSCRSASARAALFAGQSSSKRSMKFAGYRTRCFAAGADGDKRHLRIDELAERAAEAMLARAISGAHAASWWSPLGLGKALWKHGNASLELYSARKPCA